MPESSKIFIPNRSLGYVSNHIPLQVRYIKRRKENLITTCVGKSFHTYGISHFSLLSVSGLHPGDITCMTADAFHVYTACEQVIYAWRRGTELKHVYQGGHKSSIHLMLPFGPHLISVDENSAVRIWDIKEETLYADLTFSNDSFRITAICHPSTYVNKILLGSERGQMQLWNINKLKVVYNFKGWGSRVSCLEQAPALDVVAVGLENGRIILHNLKYDETVMDFTQDWGIVTCISFRSDQPIMATGCALGHIVFWDLEQRKVHSQLRTAHNSAVTGMVCLPSEPLLLTSSPDNTLKLWIFDLSDGGARLLRLREGHSVPPSFIRFYGSNGQNILSSGGSTLRIFNLRTEQFNKSLGAASYNRKVSKKRGRMLEDPLQMPPIVEFTSETTREKEWDNIAAIHEGITIVTTWSYDKLKMGQLKLLPERFYKKNVGNEVVVATSVSLTHCGNFVIVGYSTGHIDRFNMQSGLWRDSYGDPKAHNSSIRGAIADTLNQVIVSGAGLEIKFFKFKNKNTPELNKLDLQENVNFLRAHRESSMLAVALEDFSIEILDVDTRRIVRKFSGHSALITDATFSPDSRWLISSSMDRTIKTWDIPSGLLVDQFALDAACVSLSMSPTAEILATAHVDNLGVFLWANCTIYQKVTLKGIDETTEAPLVKLPECSRYSSYKIEDNNEEIDLEDEEFKSPEQIAHDLITLSGLSTSRWQNLLQIDLIRRKNKPKSAPKTPKNAPFFLPTISNLQNIQFNLSDSSAQENSKILNVHSLENLTDFGMLLKDATSDFTPVINKLKAMGPSAIDFEIKSLSPESGGSVKIMLNFLKCIEYMLKSNKDFELAEAYLSVFLKSHGDLIAANQELRAHLVNIQSCHSIAWSRLQDRFMYSLCIVKCLKGNQF